MSKVFLSYDADSKGQLGQIAIILRKLGHKIWLDKNSAFGKTDIDLIQTHVQNCDIFLLVLSSSEHLSSNYPQELDLAKSEDKPVVLLLLGSEIDPSSLQLNYPAIRLFDGLNPGDQHQLNEFENLLRGDGSEYVQSSKNSQSEKKGEMFRTVLSGLLSFDEQQSVLHECSILVDISSDKKELAELLGLLAQRTDLFEEIERDIDLLRSKIANEIATSDMDMENRPDPPQDIHEKPEHEGDDHAEINQPQIESRPSVLRTLLRNRAAVIASCFITVVVIGVLSPSTIRLVDQKFFNPLRDYEGIWSFEIDTPIGMLPGVLAIDNNQTGQLYAEGIRSPTLEIRVNDEGFEFDLNLNVEGETLVLPFSGLSVGDSLEGKISLSSIEFNVAGARVSDDVEFFDEIVESQANAPRKYFSNPLRRFLGAWSIETLSTPLGDLTGSLKIEEDITLFLAQESTLESEISNVTTDGDSIAFEVAFPALGQRSSELSFGGSINGDLLEGEFVTESGNWAVTGVRDRSSEL